MRRASRPLSLKECYAILHIDKKADLETLKTAYRKRAFELHPDLHPDDPDAGRQFQRLNEAYVALSAVLKPAGGEGAEPKGSESEAAAAGAGSEEEKKSEQAQQRKEGYAEEEVLRNLLNDPFARRVFEDIYSELTRQDQEKKKQEAASAAEQIQEDAGAEPKGIQKESSKDTKVDVSWAQKTPKNGFGVLLKSGVTGWLRRQIDEEQAFSLPGTMLTPGSRIRLRIRRGLSGELVTVEITLPYDFIPGKPVRLRGLGKRIGPWQGDLYLTLTPQ